MAYLSKEDKQRLDLQVKKVAKEYGVKLTTRRKNYTNYVITLRESKFAFNYVVNGCCDVPFNSTDINIYWFQDNKFLTDTEKEFLTKLKNIVFSKENGFYDESDAQTDYFHTAWYLSIHIGDYKKPYKQVA
jgi:hypothetical protein